MGWLSRIARRLVGKSGGARLIFPGSPWGPAAEWQIGAPPVSYHRAEANAAVHACMTIISSEFSRAVPYHHAAMRGGGFEIEERSAIARVLVRPNEYQTAVTFWAYLLRWLLADGNAYALARRNNRDEIAELAAIPSSSCYPHIEPQSGAVFYQISGDPMRPAAGARMVPARDVLHLRINCLAHPMLGNTPIAALAWPILQSDMIWRAQSAFFRNMGRPSGILKTPNLIKPDAAQAIAESWRQASSGDATGKTAVLDNGFEFQPITMSAVDAELIEQLKLTTRDIARVFRVPMFLLQETEGLNFRNSEMLSRIFFNSCLSFYFELAERELDRIFELDPVADYVEFDAESALLRAEFAEQIKALGEGVRGGIYTPNEARAMRGLPPVPGGESCYVQQQMIPLEIAIEGPPAPAPAAELEDPELEDPEELEGEETDKPKPAPGKGAAGDQALAWRGLWKAGRIYLAGELVIRNGSTWLATGATGAEPPGSGWQLFAQRGKRGAPGRDGIDADRVRAIVAEELRAAVADLAARDPDEPLLPLSNGSDHEHA